MDNNFTNIIQQGFRTVVGAMAVTLETLQDNEKRSKVISALARDWEVKSQQWAEKGSLTEEEARKIIESFFQGKEGKDFSQNSSEGEVNSSANSYQDISILTQEIISLRKELEQTK